MKKKPLESLRKFVDYNYRICLDVNRTFFYLNISPYFACHTEHTTRGWVFHEAEKFERITQLAQVNSAKWFTDT